MFWYEQSLNFEGAEMLALTMVLFLAAHLFPIPTHSCQSTAGEIYQAHASSACTWLYNMLPDLPVSWAWQSSEHIYYQGESTGTSPKRGQSSTSSEQGKAFWRRGTYSWHCPAWAAQTKTGPFYFGWGTVGVITSWWRSRQSHPRWGSSPKRINSNPAVPHFPWRRQSNGKFAFLTGRSSVCICVQWTLLGRFQSNLFP